MPPRSQQSSNINYQEQRRASGFQSLETVPQTQQSYAPSQKTLVMPHTQNLSPINPVYKSHVATERYQALQQQDKKIANPKSNVNSIQNEVGLKSIMNDSNIPQDSQTGQGQTNESQWWRNKYEEQRQQFEAIRAQDIA